MRGRLALLAAALLAATAARAHDEGRTVTFRAESAASFPVEPQAEGPKVVYESGLSDSIPEDWNTVLIQGVLPDPHVALQVLRPSPNAGAAQEWTTLEEHRFDGGRFWAKARLKDKAAGPLMLRAVSAGAKSAHSVDLYAVTVFADEPQPASAAVVPPHGPQNPSAERPLVHSRAQWRAVPPTEPYSPDPLRWRVTLHHSDGKHTVTLAESEAEARFIQDFHIHGRGWIDIGYHFLVDAAGDILEGRPENVLGAHTLSNNEGNIGIVLLGTYHPPKNDKPTKAQLAAVAAIGRYLVARYGIDPANLKGHRDYKSTDCPGDLGYAQLPLLRQAFAGAPLPPDLRRPARALKEPLAWLDGPSWDGALQPQ